MSSKFVTQEKIDGRVDSFLIQEGIQYKVFKEKPNKLTFNRLDVAFKLLYLKLRERNIRLAEEIYYSHIRAFSLGEYKERGCDTKNSKLDFIDTFNKIIDSIELSGFDSENSIIPISSHDQSIINGSHRYSVTFNNHLLTTFVELDIKPSLYDYKFFKERGVEESILEMAVTEFIERSDDCYIAILWPTAKPNSKVDEILGKLLYKKKISLSQQGAHNLLSIVYKGEPWLGEEKDNYPGIIGKQQHCFSGKEEIVLYAFQADDLSSVLRKKEEIRQLYGIGKHAIHITDNNLESIEVAQALLNENSIFFINNSNPNKYYDHNKYIFDTVLDGNKKLDQVIEGGSILSLFGLRLGRDIDVLALGEECSKCDGIDIHNDLVKYHQMPIEDLVYDSRNYFYFNGVKFISIDRLKKFKINRNEAKDNADVSLIDSILENGYKSKLKKIKSEMFFLKARCKRSCKLILKDILVKLGVFDFVINAKRNLF
ncbi:hypothetical protein BCT63_20575 [Vibrio kanaloae]|uniref:hypothetical protein n=1 Tax=Vibrio kanaloae TaxID=170673 RepID=UPI000C82B2CB|nr:hypothetical protein [Vibrio kanaloae]PML99403.1 hypothetical protein BCT63_20575 [Vibrio kanaloae]